MAKTPKSSSSNGNGKSRAVPYAAKPPGRQRPRPPKCTALTKLGTPCTRRCTDLVREKCNLHAPQATNRCKALCINSTRCTKPVCDFSANYCWLHERKYAHIYPVFAPRPKIYPDDASQYNGEPDPHNMTYTVDSDMIDDLTDKAKKIPGISDITHDERMQSICIKGKTAWSVRAASEMLSLNRKVVQFGPEQRTFSTSKKMVIVEHMYRETGVVTIGLTPDENGMIMYGDYWALENVRVLWNMLKE